MARTRTLTAVAVVALGLAGGCVSTPVNAPQDGQILLSANPSIIRLDEFATPAVTRASTVVTAQVFDANGIPQPNVELFFATDGGSLASTAALETDDNGRVSDTLTVQLGDPATINVTVRSGTISATLAITVDEAAANQPPFPVIDATPANSARFGQFVRFDGSFSDDPDGDTITCFQWQILTEQNINPQIQCPTPSARCEIIQGPTADSVTRSYDGNDVSDEQTLSVTLRVSDDPTISCPTDSATPAVAFNADTDIFYDIFCDQTPPTAAAGPNLTVSTGGTGSITITLSGAGSADPESPTLQYEWNCGNGTPVQTTQVASCTYTNGGTTPIPYTATLTVTNQCQLRGSDTAIITVQP